jgi:hypothetical protein
MFCSVSAELVSEAREMMKRPQDVLVVTLCPQV